MKISYSDQLYHPPRRGTAVRRVFPRRQEEQGEVKVGDTVPAFQKIKDAAPVLGISQYHLRQLVRESASNMAAASGGDADGARQ